jgi:hypothetical protein
MPQSTILAEGTAAATSTDVVLAAGASAVVGIFAASANVQVSQQIKVVIDTPGADNFVALLNDAQRQVQIFGPGTYRVMRSAARPGGAAIGVFSET